MPLVLFLHFNISTSTVLEYTYKTRFTNTDFPPPPLPPRFQLEQIQRLPEQGHGRHLGGGQSDWFLLTGR